jgi:hypothetical protein
MEWALSSSVLKKCALAFDGHYLKNYMKQAIIRTVISLVILPLRFNYYRIESFFP